MLPIIWVLFIFSKAFHLPISMLLLYIFSITLILLLNSYYKDNSKYGYLLLTSSIVIIVTGYLLDINNTAGSIIFTYVGSLLVVIGEILRLIKGEIRSRDYLLEVIISVLLLLTFFIKIDKPYIFIITYILIVLHTILKYRKKKIQSY